MAGNGKIGPYRADHVGSLIRPMRLIEARERHIEGALSADGLREIEDDCIRAVIGLQESVGLKAVTDGEFRRSSWHADFLTGIDNVRRAEGRLEVFHRTPDGQNAQRISGMEVTGKLGRSKPIQVADFNFVKANTRVTPKVCIPSPTIVHFRGGREAIDKTAYPELDAFYADLARVYREEIADLAANGARYIQIDDTNFAYLCDDRYREAVRRLGDDPDALTRIYCDLVNDCVRDAPADVTLCMHLCRGNASAGGAATGGYEPVAEALFGSVNIDGFFLEFDTERAGDFTPLRHLSPGKKIVLGLVSTKEPALEAKDALKRRIDDAASIVPVESLCLSPQCGFSSGVGRAGNIDDTIRKRLTEDDERAKLALVVETAAEVWGDA